MGARGGVGIHSPLSEYARSPSEGKELFPRAVLSVLVPCLPYLSPLSEESPPTSNISYRHS